jgi:hypothetical protein
MLAYILLQSVPVENHEDWPSDLDSESFPSRALWIEPFLACQIKSAAYAQKMTG